MSQVNLSLKYVSIFSIIHNSSILLIDWEKNQSLNCEFKFMSAH